MDQLFSESKCFQIWGSNPPHKVFAFYVVAKSVVLKSVVKCKHVLAFLKLRVSSKAVSYTHLTLPTKA